MPRVGLLCEITCQPVTDSECLECARMLTKRQPAGNSKQPPRHCQYTYPYIHGMTHTYDRSNAGISTTMLTGPCTRKALWEEEKDYYVFPSALHASTDGTALHEFLERHNEPEVIAEVRLIKRWNYKGIARQLTGQIDRYRPDLQRIEDHKSKGMKLFTEAPDSYVAQQNIYRWMIETGCFNMKTGERIQGTVNELSLYPAIHAGTREVSVPLWTHEQTFTFVNMQMEHFERHAQDANYVAPRGMNPNEGAFCKGYCPFFMDCLRTGGNIIPPPFDIAQLVSTDDEVDVKF